MTRKTEPKMRKEISDKLDVLKTIKFKWKYTLLRKKCQVRIL